MFENPELERLFRKKPDLNNISSIRNLKSFIQDYPNELLKQSLRDLSEIYSHYRAVNGDGNCFYRAAMFLYLREADLNNYQSLFPVADLLQCKLLPLNISKSITSQQLLLFIWQKKLLPIANQPPSKRQKQLEKLMNSSEAVDSILVAYFRVRNYDYLVKNKTQIQPFTNGGIKADLQRVLTFGKESEGVQIFSLSKIIRRTIEIMAVNSEGVIPVIYNDKAEGNKFKLFYRPGHYDIISEPQHFQKSSSTMRTQKPQGSSFFKSQATQVSSHNQSSNKSPKTTPKTSNTIYVNKPEQMILVNQSNLANKPKNNGKVSESISGGASGVVSKDNLTSSQTKKESQTKLASKNNSQLQRNPSNQKEEKQNKMKNQPVKKAQSIQEARTKPGTTIKSADSKSPPNQKAIIGQAVLMVVAMGVIAFGLLKSH